MTLPDAGAVFGVLEATWPAVTRIRAGPWLIRQGAGGGQRVSAATLESDFGPEDIGQAEAEMRGLGQPPLFMVRDGEAALDGALAERGYYVKDPVYLYVGPTEKLAAPGLTALATFDMWPPLAIMADLWAEGCIGPDRLAVMHRACAPKAAILARHGNRPAGTAFVAAQSDIAMIHAIEVTPRLRRQGVGRTLLCAAALWAQKHGATWLSLAVTQANTAANALYASLGMQVVGKYHYRRK